uniref:YEATS domain-containing protein n=1 Tax=Dendroctonus ponderosae TaxID=77166 RepID=A0AAR5QKI3_DENPD
MDQEDNKNINNVLEIDPDYETTNTALRKAELQDAEDKKLTEEKLKAIIQEQFDNELKSRQKQLDEIEDKVFKAQKLLHVLRYALISSYYKNKSLQTESTNTSTFDSTNLLLGQNRIHPAVKKLLGNNTNSLKIFAERTKRRATINKADYTNETKSEIKRIKLDPHASNETDTSTLASKIKLEPNTSKNQEVEPLTSRTKVQHKVVIGNISYFKKSLEQNNLTHKWMVYVKIYKKTEGEPEVTDSIINKVVFYLHPSYKPHDVVDISNPPYHLSRRGWGEFPLRVKIFFKSLKNKPVDVIHQLKLDNTFTERQTLGNQTTVPIFLYDDTIPTPKMEHNESKIFHESISDISNFFVDDNQLSRLNLHEPILNVEPSTSYEHDYCFDNIEIKLEPHEINDIQGLQKELSSDLHIISEPSCLHDHAYSIPSHKENQKSPKKNKSPVKQVYNELIYGLGPHYLDRPRSRPKSIKTVANDSTPEKNAKLGFKVLKTVTGQSIRFLPESFNKVLLNNGNIVSVKLLKSRPSKSGENREVINLDAQFFSKAAKSHQKNHSSVRTIVRQERRLLGVQPIHKFKNMGEALPYLFKRLPLWTTEANDLDYKCTYPFTACLEKEFMSWNIGKRLAAEWSRAKAIKRIVASEPYSEHWTTKAIFMYGRSHAYSPAVSSYKLFQKESLEKHLIQNCFRGNRLENGVVSEPIVSDEHVNVTSPIKPVIDQVELNSIDSCIDLSDKRLTSEYAFVKEAALDVGVILKPEVLTEGVSMNASKRIMLEAVKCFADNLIRRSRNNLVCQNNYKPETSEITINEIQRVLEERREFNSIKKFKQDKSEMDFFP